MTSTLRVAAIVLIGVTLILYLEAYRCLRNRGLREAEKYETDGFLYESVEVIERSHDLTTHHFRAWLFAPLNRLDCYLFDCPPPIRCIMFDLDSFCARRQMGY